MDIAIIGGGAAAVALLDALAVSAGDEDRAAPGTVTVFEPSPQLWRGRPYAPDLDSVLVNSIPSAHVHPRRRFRPLRELAGGTRQRYIDEALGQPLVPRALYGEYLAHTAEKAVAALSEAGRAVHVVPARVAEIVRADNGFVLSTSEGQNHPASHLALCVGGGTPPDLYGLAGHPAFVPDPYPLVRTLDGVPADSAVSIIGSGLTAVDIVVSLAAQGHSGPITLVSRSGDLPYVWQRPIARRPRHLTRERIAELHRLRGRVTLDDLVDLLRTELADAGENFDDLAADIADRSERPIARLRRQFAAIDDPRIGRRVLQESAHLLGPYVWPLLPEADRVRLRGHFRTATALASPMVPVNASAVLRLLDSGQLALAPGAQAIEPERAGFRVCTASGGQLADIVVNAVNPPPQAIPAAARATVGSLVAAGLAGFHPDGGMTPAEPRIQVVGDLLGGGSIITSGISGVAAQAARAARALRPDHTG